MGAMSRRQRRLLWIGFVLVAGNAAFAAWLLNDASWLFNLVVASLVGTVLSADDIASRRQR